MTKCSKCNDKHYSKGLCQRHYSKKYYQDHDEYIKKEAKKYRKINKKYISESKKKHNKTLEGKRSNKNSSLLWNYGITLEEYEQLMKKQDNKCAICGEEKQLVVDHDHKTKKIRGLLCNQCNTGIGLLKDNTNILQKSINYLKMVST